jgi:branched-chain amino acid transport system ATP-binding protein
MTTSDNTPQAMPAQRTLLMTQQLRKSFGETRAVDGIDFVVQEGEVLALVGSNGAGKTSLVNLISGLLQPDSGTIFFRGREINQLAVYERIKAGIARSFQLVNLFDQLTAFENVRLSILSRDGKTQRLFRLVDRDRDVQREVLEVLDRFGLADKSHMLAGGLAQGERKLLDVAVAYALRPTFLLLDEPTSGVSTREKATIMDTISEVVKSGRITAVIIEHDMDVVFTYAARIVMMHQGRILADGTPDEIRRNEEVATTLLGGSFAS